MSLSFSGIAQFIVGVIIGISLLVGSGAATAYYFFTKLSANPAKPIFAEEVPQESPVAKPASSPNKPPSQTQQAKATPSKPPEQKLAPGTYQAVVTWPEGLSLRDAPSLEANRIGGVAYDQEVIILKKSDDQKWQQVRLADGEQQGWVKAGNVRRVDN
ncbi:SH3 domain-containing protein [Lyngbya aestuarii]|uniref:SH3 domain-containing protein n=1 Tax=Lyngbya aestuarii TaxID=118322 RepID=UPI00403DAD1D